MQSSPQTTAKRVLIAALLSLSLLALNVIVFRDHWMGRTSFTFDFPEGYYGTVAYWISAVQSWEWPQWIPYQSMGYPLLMNPQMGIFYPPFWLFVLLRIPYTLHAANVFQVLHIWFGCVGVLILAYRMFRSWIAAECGAVAFLFFGGFYTNAEHADIIRGFAWVPWLLWAGLVSDTTRWVKLWRFRFETSLGRSTLALPLIVACFITGAYTGQVIAGLLLFGVLVTAQAVERWFRSRNGMLFRDLALQFGSLALGVAMTAVFLIPGLYLSHELTRAQGIAGMVAWYMSSRNLFDLIFPSDMVHPGFDYSMWGMQMPIALWVFVLLTSRRQTKALVPFFAVAAAAVFMSFVAFLPATQVIRRLFPILGLSRFAAGDYREYLYLAILLTALAGLTAVIESHASTWMSVSLALTVLVLFSIACFSFVQHDLAPTALQPFLRMARTTTWAGLGAVAVLYLARRWQTPRLLAVAIPALTFAAMLPVINEIRPFWSDPGVFTNMYDAKGLPLTVNGHLRTYDIFKHREAARPPRQTAGQRDWTSWRGYLDGSYMTDDPGGAVSLSRTRIESDPRLFGFIRKGSTIVAADCATNSAACTPNPGAVDVAAAPAAGRSVEYGRERIVYDVQVPARSLVVENEVSVAGWHAKCDGKGIPVEKVDGSLRGWIVPAGRHRVELSYATPWLKSSLTVSLLAVFSWLACVILISSDRTGG